MAEDIGQQLRLIYSQLKDAESDPEKRLELLERSREELGQMIDKMDRKPGLFSFMSENGAKGGAVKSSAKAAAARANGAKGGRPKFMSIFSRFPEDSIKVLMLAQEEARQLGHNRCGTEQLLLGLIGEGNGRAAQALSSMGLTITDARATVKQLVGQGHDFDTDLSAPRAGGIAKLVGSLRGSKEIPFSQFAKKVLESSFDEAGQGKHTDCIETEHLLLGILDVQECRGFEVLRKHGIDAIKLRETLTAKQ
jgi:hypothetical protein